MKHSYNELSYNELGYNELGYNKHTLGFNEYSVLKKRNSVPSNHFTTQNNLVITNPGFN